jgi:hypothetical protein
MQVFNRALGIACLVLSILATLPTFAEDNGAKGLFFTQLDKQKENLNTGIQYWIEIDRNKNVSRVNNKTIFHSGDKVRFHVKPNIDGYAYIMLRSGSRGEKAVLFPDPQRNEDNKLEHGREYILPNDGALAFDANPGIEKLTLLLSRNPIDTTAYLAPNSTVDAQVQIASLDGGSKDLIPSEVLVSYVPSSPSVKATAAGTEAADSAAPPKTIARNPITARTAIRPRVKHPHAGASVSQKTQADDTGITTVVYKQPTGLLAVDVCLQHL